MKSLNKFLIGCLKFGLLALIMTACSIEPAADVEQISDDFQIPIGPNDIGGTLSFERPVITISNGLDFVNFATLPMRRIRVIAYAAADGTTLVAETTTNDVGFFAFRGLPTGTVVVITASAELVATNYKSDTLGLNNCEGASWNVHAEDSDNANAIWKLADSTPVTLGTSNYSNVAKVSYNGSTFDDRTSSPFSILDDVVVGMEAFCTVDPDNSFDELSVRWSLTTGNSSGFVGSTPAQLRVGATSTGDDFDTFIILHEYGHYIDETEYRKDSPGGTHSSGYVEDARLALAEGFATFYSVMAVGSANYIKTGGTGNTFSSLRDISAAITGDSRTAYNEASVSNFLWLLYENTDGAANSGNYAKIHNIFLNFNVTTPAQTTIQSFASYYNQVYGGSSESLQSLWLSALDAPYDSLCSGTCSGSGDTADPWDLDNDLGVRYVAQGKKYRENTGTTRSAEFWRLYRTVTVGSNTGTNHEIVDWDTYPSDTHGWGRNRFFRYVEGASAKTVSVQIANLVGSICDVGDPEFTVIVYENGVLLDFDISASGSQANCFEVNFTSEALKEYVIVVRPIFSADGITSYDINVSAI